MEKVTYDIDGIEYEGGEPIRPFVMPEDCIKASAWVFGIIMGLVVLEVVLEFAGVIVR
jgi:hypothetical protein